MRYMTVKDILDYVDEVKQNTFSRKTKLIWLNELEYRVQTDVMLLSAEGIQTIPDDDTHQLLVPVPWSEIYYDYLFMKLSEHLEESSEQNNRAATFNKAFTRFMRWWADTYNPSNGRAIFRGYYLKGPQGEDGAFRINVTLSGGVFSADKTFDEIKAAYNAGQQPYVVQTSGASDIVYTLAGSYLPSGGAGQEFISFERYLIFGDTLETVRLRIFSYTLEDGSNIEQQISPFNDENVKSAELDENNMVSFKNADGIVLFTLDLSELGTPASYGNLVLPAESLTIEEGGTGGFTVALDSAPSANQIVYLAVSDNTRLTVSPVTLTFTPANYAEPQTVTVTALQDEDEYDDTITVTLTSRKVDAKQLLVSIVDDDKPVMVENGMEFYINLRNMADQTSAATQIVDSVGGVVCTTQNVAFDDTSGFLDNDGLTLPTANSKLQYQYPIKTENVPNGFTYEITTKGTGTFHGAGNGFGDGYAYKAWLASANSYGQFYGGLAHHFADGTNSIGVSNTGLADDVDWTQEHTLCFVNEVDGTFNTYVDGVLKCVGTVNENFERYNISGTITFKIPYSEIDVAPMEVAAVRIYERALTADEVLQNAKFDISQRAVQTF